MKSIDIVISFDTTGSMYPCLALVKRNINQIVEDLFNTITNLRVGVICHGDYCDGKDIIKSLDLTDDKDRIKRFVSNSNSTYGGDAPEAYEVALASARGMSWRSKDNKIIIMIGDDEPNDRRKYLSVGVPFIDWENECELLSTLGVKIFSVQCLNRNYASNFYRALADKTGGVCLQLNQFSNIESLLYATFYNQESPQAFQDYTNRIELNVELARILSGLNADFKVTRGDKFIEENSVRSAKSVAAYGTHKVHGADTERASVGRVTAGAITKRDLQEFDDVDPARFQVLAVVHDTDIKGFVEGYGIEYKKGRGFYELTKPETIQENKEVIIQQIKTGDIFTGKEVRDKLGIPLGKRGKLVPSDNPGFKVFVQSTSMNRKLIGNTSFMYEAK